MQNKISLLLVLAFDCNLEVYTLQFLLRIELEFIHLSARSKFSPKVNPDHQNNVCFTLFLLPLVKILTKLQHSVIDICWEMYIESEPTDHYLFIVAMILKTSPGITLRGLMGNTSSDSKMKESNDSHKQLSRIYCLVTISCKWWCLSLLWLSINLGTRLRFASSNRVSTTQYNIYIDVLILFLNILVSYCCIINYPKY